MLHFQLMIVSILVNVTFSVSVSVTVTIPINVEVTIKNDTFIRLTSLLLLKMVALPIVNVAGDTLVYSFYGYGSKHDWYSKLLLHGCCCGCITQRVPSASR